MLFYIYSGVHIVIFLLVIIVIILFISLIFFWDFVGFTVEQQKMNFTVQENLLSWIWQ